MQQFVLVVNKVKIYDHPLDLNPHLSDCKSDIVTTIEPTITWVPLGFSGYIWLDTKIVLKKTLYHYDT